MYLDMNFNWLKFGGVNKYLFGILILSLFANLVAVFKYIQLHTAVEKFAGVDVVLEGGEISFNGTDFFDSVDNINIDDMPEEEKSEYIADVKEFTSDVVADIGIPIADITKFVNKKCNSNFTNDDVKENIKNTVLRFGLDMRQLSEIMANIIQTQDFAKAIEKTELNIDADDFIRSVCGVDLTEN